MTKCAICVKKNFCVLFSCNTLYRCIIWTYNILRTTEPTKRKWIKASKIP